jgi:hypothetical protein
MGGYIATVETWAAFTKDWCAELAREPKLAYVKAQQAASRTGCFDVFGPEERDARLLNLVNIMNNHLNHGFALGVDERDYYNVFKGRTSVTLDSPYFHISLLCMRRALELQREYFRSLEEVSFIFDDYSNTLKEEIWSFWNELRGRGPRWMKRRLGPSPIWQDERKWLPLQAADVVVWVARRLAIDQFHPSLARRPLSSFPFINLKPAKLEFITKAQLEAFHNEMVFRDRRRGIPQVYESGKDRSKRLADQRRRRLRPEESP